jgi:hypothetical protein
VECKFQEEAVCDSFSGLGVCKLKIVYVPGAASFHEFLIAIGKKLKGSPVLTCIQLCMIKNEISPFRIEVPGDFVKIATNRNNGCSG